MGKTSARCAIYGIKNSYNKPDFEDNHEHIKAHINRLISEGVSTFVTASGDGYELDAARYIIELKRNNPTVHLIIVRPYKGSPTNWRTKHILESVMKDADMVKYTSADSETFDKDMLDEWIISHCDNVICVTSGTKSNLTRLNKFDLHNKKMIYIPERTTVVATSIYEETTGYPTNILSELFNISEDEIELSAYPDDIEERLVSLFERSLNEREIFVMEERFIEGKTLQEIGDSLNLSRERIRQIVNKALRKLKYRKKIADLFDNDEFASTPAISKNAVVIRGSAIGNKWTIEEEKRLIEEFQNGVPMKIIAEAHGRNTGGIRARLKKLGMIDAADEDSSIDAVEVNQMPASNDNDCFTAELPQTEGTNVSQTVVLTGTQKDINSYVEKAKYFGVAVEEIN